MDVWTLIGTIASIIGAIISFNEAGKAKKSADIARNVKEHIVEHRNVKELSQMHMATQKLLKILAKYGVSSDDIGLKGINFKNDSQDIQEYIFFMKDNKFLFSFEENNEVDILCEKLNLLLTDFVNEDKSIKKIKACEIIVILNEFSPIIKKKLYEKSESINTIIK